MTKSVAHSLEISYTSSMHFDLLFEEVGSSTSTSNNTHVKSDIYFIEFSLIAQSLVSGTQ